MSTADDEEEALALTRAENSSSRISSPVSCFFTSFFFLLCGEGCSDSNIVRSRPFDVDDGKGADDVATTGVMEVIKVLDSGGSLALLVLDGNSSAGRRASNAESAFDLVARVLVGGIVGTKLPGGGNSTSWLEETPCEDVEVNSPKAAHPSWLDVSAIAPPIGGALWKDAKSANPPSLPPEGGTEAGGAVNRPSLLC